MAAISSLLSCRCRLRANQILAVTKPGLLGAIERLEFLALFRLVDQHRTGLGNAILEVPEQTVDLWHAGELVHSVFLVLKSGPALRALSLSCDWWHVEIGHHSVKPGETLSSTEFRGRSYLQYA